MKRLLGFMLVVCLMLTLLAGCKQDGVDSDTQDPNNDTVTTDEIPPYDPKLDELDFDGLELTFYYADVSDMTRKEFESESYTGDIISDVIYVRNDAVKNKFNVQLGFTHMDGIAMVDDLRNKYMAQDATYDIVATYAYHGVSLAIEGVYADLNEIENLDVSSSWWNQSYVEEITYQDQLYSIVGDINTSVTSKTMATFVNKQMLSEFGFGDVDLFKVVEDGDWTLEYMINMCKDVYQEDDNIPDRSDEDVYGFILGQISQPAETLLVSFGFDWSNTNDDGSIELALSSYKNVDILTGLEGFYSGSYTGIYKMPSAGDFSKYGAQNYTKLFTANKTMVTIAPLYTAEELVKTEIDYLMLPLPKFDVVQTEYRTSCLDSHCNTTISAVSDSKAAAGAVLEYMGYLSEKDLTPQYFDVSYKLQYASDANTMKLFDDIVSSVKFDFARTYSKSINAISQKMRTLVKDSLEISSSIASYENACQGYLDSLVRKFQGLNG